MTQYPTKPERFEQLTPTKRIRREDIHAVYTELTEYTEEVLNEETNEIEVVTKYNEPELLYWQAVETIEYSTGYLLLTEEDYTALNKAVSIAYGFPDDSHTLRFYTNEPEKINDLCLMVVSQSTQQAFPELFEGVELMNSMPQEITEEDEAKPE